MAPSEPHRSSVKRLEDVNAQAHYRYAAAAARAGKTSKAIDAYKLVLLSLPSHTGALLGLGHALKTIGRGEDAVAAYRRCTKLKPHQGETYWSLANLKTHQLSKPDIHTMEAALAGDRPLSETSKIHFLFALARAREDAGEFDAAWENLQRGNQLKHQLEPYDPAQSQRFQDELITVFNKSFLEQASSEGNTDAAPIFVVGLPRSGSTLIEQILASHSWVEGTAELPYLGRMAKSLDRNSAEGTGYPQRVRDLTEPHLKALGRQYLDLAQSHRHLETPRFIDKNPNNFLAIGLLKLILPNAKIIDARRYPLDSALSCYRQLFAKGQRFSYELSDLGNYCLNYHTMMDHWQTVLPGAVYKVQYEALVTDFEQQVRALLVYCDLPFERACLNFFDTERPVRTASSEQVRQPPYTTSIHFWRNYEAHLDELVDILGPILPRYRAYEHINR